MKFAVQVKHSLLPDVKPSICSKNLFGKRYPCGVDGQEQTLDKAVFFQNIILEICAAKSNNARNWLIFKPAATNIRFIFNSTEAVHPFPLIGSDAASQTLSFASIEHQFLQQKFGKMFSTRDGACDPDRHFVSGMSRLVCLLPGVASMPCNKHSPRGYYGPAARDLI